MWRLLLSSRRQLIRRVVLALGLVAVIWFLLCFLAVHSLTRRARTLFEEKTPQVTGKAVEEHRLKTVDGEEIGTWFVNGAQELPVVLLIHGNGGQRKSCWPQAEFLHEAGYPVMLITCRAHGDSTGKVNDIGYSARHDIIAAVKWLRSRAPEQPVVLFGASLGSAAAVFAAHDLQDLVDGFILECPYRDLNTACWNRLDNTLPPIVDVVTWIGMRLAASVILPEFSRISPIDHIGHIPHAVPVLILAGGADKRARPHGAEALHNRIRNHSRLEIIPDADHLQLLSKAPDLYRKLVLDYLKTIKRTADRSAEIRKATSRP